MLLVNYYCTMAGIKVSILKYVQREQTFFLKNSFESDRRY